MTSQTPDMPAVLARLERLERQNLTLTGAGAAALIAVGAVLLTGQAPPTCRTIQAEKFNLTDSKGKLQAEWATTSGEPHLVFYDEEGLIRLGIYVNRGGSSLAMFGAQHGNIAVVNVRMKFEDDGPGLELMDTQGYSAVLGGTTLTTEASGEVQKISAASLALVGKDRKVIWRAP